MTSHEPWAVSLADLSHAVFATDQPAPPSSAQDNNNNNKDLWARAQTLLSAWAGAGWTRATPLRLTSCDPDAALKLWCARIFKRGLENITWDGQQVPSNQAQALVQKDTLVMTPEFTSSHEILSHIVGDLDQGDSICILDEGFARHWPDYAQLARHSPRVICYQPSESTKRLETLAAWVRQLGPIKTLRRVWSVGGGITSDLGGFFAGLFGLEHSTCPTTLLSAYDASLGGKTGANLPPWGKNQVGLFYPTTRWLIAPEHFTTLPKQEVLCALAEALKHVWLAGQAGHAECARIEKLVTGMDSEPAATLTGDWVRASVVFHHGVKASLVRADPYETGVRSALNLGHTLAHVLEALADEGWLDALPHGLAVAIGMKCLLDFGWIRDPSNSFAPLLGSLLHQAGCSLPLRVSPSQKSINQTQEEPGGNNEAATSAPRSSFDSGALFWSRFEQLARADKKQSLDGAVSEATVTFVAPPFGFASSLMVGHGQGQTDHRSLTENLFRKVPTGDLAQRCRELPLVIF